MNVRPREQKQKRQLTTVAVNQINVSTNGRRRTLSPSGQRNSSPAA
jgi:hypothetical protein